MQAILDDESSLSESSARYAIREVLKALDYLHRRNVAHLDIKLQNILLNSNNLEGEIDCVATTVKLKSNLNLQMD